MPATDQPVCVTGASGFIASHLVSDLLAAGYRVRGTVRGAPDDDRYAYLTGLPGAAERLELVTANLDQPESFEPVVRGCAYVHHTASPYRLTVKDPQRDLVDPALNGTRGVLAACKRARAVKRVVVTSSMAALTDEPDESKVLTEADWNETSSLTRNPYYYSKTVAERAAWEFVETDEPAFDVVVINPFLVIGPSLTPSLNESNQVLADLLNGNYPGIVRVGWGFVDVRDVAGSHVLAMETASASGRYICAGEITDMRGMVERLKQLGFGHYKLPKLGLDSKFGDSLARVGALFQPKGVRQYIRTHIGRMPAYDNTKIKRELGLEFRSLDESVKAAIADMIQWNHIAERQPRA